MIWLLLACGTPLQPADTDGADTGPGATDSAADSADDTGIELVDTAATDDSFLYADQILGFGLTLDDAAVASLTADPDTDVHATFAYEGETYDVGVHLKGNYSFRDLTGKASFKVDFHQWEPDQTFHGVRRLTLNNMVQDASMSAEHLAYALDAALGLVAPRHGYAQVTVNGELFGLYGIVETADEQFVDRYFDGVDGNLYQGGYGADVTHGRVDNFDVKEQGTPDDRSDLQALIDAEDATTPDTFVAFLDTYFDNTDALLDMWAAELVIADVDAYTTLANNFFLYHDPTTDKWTMIPWGPDQSFATDLDVHTAYYGDMAIKCAASSACAERLDERIGHVLEVWQSMDLSTFASTETARIEDACRTDPRSPWGDYGCRDAQAALRAWVDARPAVVEGQLAGR